MSHKKTLLATLLFYPDENKALLEEKTDHESTNFGVGGNEHSFGSSIVGKVCVVHPFINPRTKNQMNNLKKHC